MPAANVRFSIFCGSLFTICLCWKRSKGVEADWKGC